MPIIDCHTHAYPKEVIADPLKWADTHKELHWKELVVSTPQKQSLQGWADVEEFIQAMEAAGVDKAVLLGWYWENIETCELQNKWHVQWVNRYPKRFIPFAPVQPLSNKNLDTLKKAYDRGVVKGIGEVHPGVQGFSLRDKKWLKIVEWAIEKHLPINLHVTEPVGHNYKGKVATPLEDYVWLAQTYPEAKFILAHWGGLLLFYELNPWCKKALKNVYYDTSASPLLYEDKIFKIAVEAVGPDKILYGSDFPLKIYPKRQGQPNFKDFIEAIQELGFSQEVSYRIFYKNILKLLPTSGSEV